jgi:predicted secreted protein
MGLATGIAIYLTIWWTVLFAVLPLWTRPRHEAD